MAAHPLFDETVVERLRGVTDTLVPFVPDSIHAVSVILRPGPSDDPAATTLDVIFPAEPAPDGWSVPDSLNQAARVFAAAWLAHGQPMPAFRFSHRRQEDGRWQASVEPLEEW